MVPRRCHATIVITLYEACSQGVWAATPRQSSARLTHAMRLNGWQRLWVVLAALYGIVVITIAWSEWPQESRIRRFEVTTDEPEPNNKFQILWGGADVPSKEVAASIRQSSRVSSVTSRPTSATAGPSLSTDPNARASLPYMEVEYESESIYFPAGTLDFTVERELRRYDQGVWPERRSHLLTAGTVWAAPMIFLYVFGSAVSWIVRGFRTD